MIPLMYYHCYHYYYCSDIEDIYRPLIKFLERLTYQKYGHEEVVEAFSSLSCSLGFEGRLLVFDLISKDNFGRTLDGLLFCLCW